MSRRHCSQFFRQRPPSQIGALNMRKLIVGLLTLLSLGCLILSGCGMRQCLQTNTGCETDSENNKPCREFGGPTTGCNPVEPGAHLVN